MGKNASGGKKRTKIRGKPAMEDTTCIRGG